jgi:hypothetical protein
VKAPLKTHEVDCVEEDRGLTKTFYDETNGAPVLVALEIEDLREVFGKVREQHKKEMKECLVDGRELLGPAVSGGAVVTLACALFERRALAAFTLLQNALNLKVQEKRYALRRERESAEEPVSAECADCGDELTERTRARGFTRCFFCYRKSKAARADEGG